MEGSLSCEGCCCSFDETHEAWKGSLGRKRISALDGQGKSMHQLCFIDMIINGREVQALVDTGASHNFLQASWLRSLGSKSQQVRQK
jgi:predicted aspartyl protease